MVALNIHPRGEGMLDGVDLQNVTHVEDMITIGALDHGTVAGKPTVSICIPLRTGRWVVAQTTLALFLTAADAFKAAHGDPRR